MSDPVYSAASPEEQRMRYQAWSEADDTDIAYVAQHTGLSIWDVSELQYRLFLTLLESCKSGDDALAQAEARITEAYQVVQTVHTWTGDALEMGPTIAGLREELAAIQHETGLALAEYRAALDGQQDGGRDATD